MFHFSLFLPCWLLVIDVWKALYPDNPFFTWLLSCSTWLSESRSTVSYTHLDVYKRQGIAKHILAHENSNINQRTSAEKNNNVADQLFPDLTYSDRWQQSIGDEIIDIQYLGPAHTNGDSIIHFQNANVVHCGDLVFNRRYPYIDKSAGASIENWIEILQQMQSYYDNDALFIFGHAREGYDVTGNKNDLAAFGDYLTALLEFVSKEISSGKSREQILTTTAIPGAPQWIGDGIERSLNAALEEIVRE